MMAQQEWKRATDRSNPGMLDRLTTAASRLESVAQNVSERNTWDEWWTDTLEDHHGKREIGPPLPTSWLTAGTTAGSFCT